MRYKFGFMGGVVKHPIERVVSKFLLFHLLPSLKTGRAEEQIFFSSLKKGFIVDSLEKPGGGRMQYTTENPNFKVFSLVDGFGLQKQFCSFYLTLDILESMTTILPLCSVQQDHYFIARFRFMRPEEIKDALGEDSVSYMFHKKQLPLARNLMSRIIVKGEGVEVGVNPASTHSIRKIRF